MIETGSNNRAAFIVSREEKIISWAFTLIAITSTLAINHSDSTLPERQYLWVSHTILACSLIFLIFKTLTRSFKMQAAGLLFVFSFWYLVITLYTYKGNDVSLNLSTIISLLLFCCYDKKVWAFSYNLYYKYILLISFLGIIAFLSIYLPIGLPKTICPYYGSRLSDSYLYYDYHFAYIVVEGPFTRLCGLFNEPGYFGTFLGLFLVAENFNLKKKSNIILLIAGIFTFSAAFFITLILYFILKLILTRNIKILFAGVFIFLSIIVVGGENENVAHLMERFTFVDGKLNAINRTGSGFDYFFNNYIKTSRLFIGYGGGFLEHNQEIGNLSYKTYLVEYGLFACLIFWGGLFYNAIKYSSRNQIAIVFSILFMINIYQRPGIFVFGYMLLLYGGVSYISLMSKERCLEHKA